MADDQFSLNFEAPRPQARPWVSVSELTTKVKNLLELEVGDVWVKGEISGFKPSAAGHLYFSLKDSGAVLSCAMFRAGGRVKFELKDGLEVLVHGRVSVYAPRGNYQLIVQDVEPVGAGALQLAFEQLKEKLQKEGLFDLARKKPIPAHPTKIAIVTSPTGAALQDMLNVLGRRNAGISILVVPTLVQGDAAPAQIVRAIQVVNKHNLADVLVVARGGGSLEDLWCFNDEAVVRAVAESRIPTISAVGHEVDFTLCDFAADLRAPTPSAAAELVSRNRLELVDMLLSSQRRLVLAMGGRLSHLKSALLMLENRLVSPSEKLLRYAQQLDELQAKMTYLIQKDIAENFRTLEGLSGRLEALSPLKVLGRGYTLIQDSSTGRLVKSVKDAAAGEEVVIKFHDGNAQARIL